MADAQRPGRLWTGRFVGASSWIRWSVTFTLALLVSLPGAAADSVFQRQSEAGDRHFAAGRFAESLSSYRRALVDPATGLKRDPSSESEFYVVPDGWNESPQVGRTLARLAASHMALVESASSTGQRGIHLNSALDVATSSLLALEQPSRVRRCDAAAGDCEPRAAGDRRLP